MKHRLTSVVLVATLAVSMLAGVAAQATDNPCDDDTVIFSYRRSTVAGVSANIGGLNANALTCFADDGEFTGDNRRLVPQANRVSVRYLQDLGPDVVIVAVLNGQGLTNLDDYLLYEFDATLGEGFYDSPALIELTPGPGTLTADIYLEELDENGDPIRTLLDSTHFASTTP